MNAEEKDNLIKMAQTPRDRLLIEMVASIGKLTDLCEDFKKRIEWLKGLLNAQSR